jgi:hypothetical protein
MKLHIVELSEKNGVFSPDPQKVVAKVKLKPGEVDLEFLKTDYERDLKELFAKPFYAFSLGFSTPEGIVGDAGLEEIPPWDSRILKLLPERLSILGLDFLIVEK